ncbi:MAG: helix-turn-helix domain-containing protein [Lachnospiraceae bacterium]|nr:helix-turn-helix domain-containing protein [Ruminococcus sp.]MCM1276683.1 helix-turn-helix domain-containing protein [Lachnospiraceae bacterium]
MLIFNFHTIGDRLLAIRKKAGMTQAQVAEAADISDRAYADIERGTVNMRIETVLRICTALNITPDEILTEDNPSLTARQEELIERLNSCTQREREAALDLLAVYLNSLNGI